MRFQHGELTKKGVQARERGVLRAEEVFEQVGRDLRVEPEEANLAVVDEVGAAFFDAGEGGAEGGREEEVACFRGREAGGRFERVEGDDARVEEERELEGGGRFEETHRVGAAVGGFGAGWERV